MKRLFTALLLFGLPFQATAKDLTEAELREIQSKIKSSDSLTVDFAQTKISGLRGKKTTRHGRAQFVKPTLFRWMLETPTKEYKIYDGKDLYDFDPVHNTAAKYSPTGPKAYELKQIVDLVLNFDSLLKRYDLVKASEDGDLVSIELKPKTSGDITAIDLKVSQKDAFITYLKLALSNKTQLVHEFKNPSHQVISDEAFRLPKGVKVTDTN
jgi:chaperone LolA